MARGDASESPRFAMFPSADQTYKTTRGIMRLPEHDLEMFETPDGYRRDLPHKP
jgi:hypothetical protein